MMTGNNFTVLLAEDNQHDIAAMKRVWKKQKLANPLHIVKDGEECLDYLHRRGRYAASCQAPAPVVLLLDIRMPKIDGFTVLEKIRKNKKLCCLPVIMLTSLQEKTYKIRSYQLGATAYIVKPVGIENLSQIIDAINLFWRLVELPVQLNAYN